MRSNEFMAIQGQWAQLRHVAPLPAVGAAISSLLGAVESSRGEDPLDERRSVIEKSFLVGPRLPSSSQTFHGWHLIGSHRPVLLDGSNQTGCP